MNGRRTTGKMKRYRGVKVVLSKRDRLVFRALSKAKVMRTPDFVSLAFPSLIVARRRLRRLMDAGYIACYVRSLHEPNHWMLDRLGYEEVTGEVSERRAPRGIKGFKAHHMTGVRFWSLLVQACHTMPNISLKKYRFEWELAPDGHLNTLTSFRPDAICTINAHGRDWGCFIEVDRSTEGPKVVAQKLEVFARLRAGRTPIDGVMPDRLLLLADTPRRLRAIARSYASPTTPVFTRVFTESSEELALERGWQRLQDVQRQGADVGLFSRGL